MGRAKIRIVLLAAVGLLAVFLGGQTIWQFLRSQPDDCARDQWLIGQSLNGDQVLEGDEVCDGLAHSDVVTLTFRPRQGAPLAFFSYWPSYVPDIAEPKIVWTSPNILTVNIARIGEVYLRRDQTRNFIIRYEIGRVGAD